jgi:hypothetical protein
MSFNFSSVAAQLPEPAAAERSDAEIKQETSEGTKSVSDELLHN